MPDLSDSATYRNGDTMPVAAVEVAGIRTVLAVPMFKDDLCIGAIALSRREVRLFAEKQVDLVANFAKQAVIAIENARLLREIRARTDDLVQPWRLPSRGRRRTHVEDGYRHP